MLKEDIFSKEVEGQLKYFRISSQKGKGKLHFPINLCYIDTHRKELELKDTFKKLKVLDDIAKKFNVGYVLHFKEQTFVAVFDFAAIGFDVALTIISVKIKNPQMKRLITEVKKAGLFLAIATLIFVVFASIVTVICALVY